MPKEIFAIQAFAAANNDMTHTFDILVLGAGPGGYIAALKAAQLGAKVAIVEKHHLGGTCLNYGCIPSKALLASAELLHGIHHARDYGITVPPGVTYDWSAIQGRKDKVLRQLRGGIGTAFKNRAVTLLPGLGRFDGSVNQIVIDPTQADPKPTGAAASNQPISPCHAQAKSVILAVGSVPVRIPGWPGDTNIVCTSDEAVHWKTLPKQLLIVGGGVIGCEFACLMNAMGVQVTVVEWLPRLLPTLDAELGTGLEKIFKARGITLHLQTKVEDMKLAGQGAQARLSNNTTLEVDRVLVCVGRAPNTKNLGLESLGVNLSNRGFVPVDDTMQTNKPGLYCIGDANGRCLLAHAASAHGTTAVGHALGHTYAGQAPVPSAVYTFPEVGSVGWSQEECVAQNLPISVGKFPLGYLGKALAAQHTDGFVKVIRHRETDAILGVHILGHNATEYIAAAGTMVHQKATVHDLAQVVFAHPTLSEAIKESAEDALGMALHLPPRKIHTLEAVMT